MTLRSLTRIPHILFGADYNPEQWDESTIDDDIVLMQEAAVNVVTLPVFAWSRIEPAFNQFDFEWLDEVIEKLWSAGISIDLATATATPPPWLVRDHPEMLPVNSAGVRLEFGSRQSYCPSSPVWRSHCARMAQKMVDRYGKHPAVVMWHVSNEYGDHISRCYCEESTRDFQNWLEMRYADVARLNAAWGTSSWGQIYTSFDQIKAPTLAPGPINPSHTLDFDRFSSDALLELFRVEVDVIRSTGSEIPITTNFMSFFKDLDYWDFADLEDVVSDDAYPDPSDPYASVDAALNYGFMRSLKRKPWILLEQAPSAVSWREINVPKLPGTTRLFSLQAIAHGSDGVMFFQWRAGRFGTEKFHSAIVGHRGIKSRTWLECKALGLELKRYGELVGTQVLTPVAMLADYSSRWALESPESMPAVAFNWIDLARKWNRALAKQGIAVDIVHSEMDASQYKVIVVPNAYLVDEHLANFLDHFANSGGVVVVGPFSGVVNENDHVHIGGAPGPLSDLLGISVDEWWPMAIDAKETLHFAGEEYVVERWSEWLDSDTATVLGSYSSGALKGRPGVTVNRRGQGHALYVSADVSQEGLDSVLRYATDLAGLNSFVNKVPIGVDLTLRSDGDENYLCVVNFSTDDYLLPEWAEGMNLTTGNLVGVGDKVRHNDAAIIKLTSPHLW